MESTDQRYERLKQRVRRMPICSPRDCAGREKGSGESDAESATGRGGSESGGQKGKSRVGDEGQRKKSGRSRRKGVGRTVDDHGVWQEAQKDRQRSESAVEGIIKEAVMEVGAKNVPEALRGALDKLGIGRTAGEGEYELRGDEKGRLKWRHLLRRCVGQVLEIRPVFNRPPRRFPELVGIVPGKHRPDLIVYFTDGYGPAPTQKPRVPVIWCLLPGGEPPADWGRIIRMEEQKSIE